MRPSEDLVERDLVEWDLVEQDLLEHCHIVKVAEMLAVTVTDTFVASHVNVAVVCAEKVAKGVVAK